MPSESAGPGVTTQCPYCKNFLLMGLYVFDGEDVVEPGWHTVVCEECSALFWADTVTGRSDKMTAADAASVKGDPMLPVVREFQERTWRKICPND